MARIDIHYQKMIDDINESASDREQLLIIRELVKNLQKWNSSTSEDSVEKLYYNNMDEILKIIGYTLNKEDELNG